MIQIRKALKEDMEGVHELVRELAAYEKAPEAVETSPKIYQRDGFELDNTLFECLIAENTGGKIVGIALFFFGYSTWKGKLLYLDDLVVSESYRRQGIGRRLLDNLVAYGVEQDARMIKWQVLDWNTPAIEMYKGLEAHFDGGWIDCKLYRDQMENWTS